MKAFYPFLKKEITESLRSRKLVLLSLVFLLFGFLNPAIAQLTPILLPQLLPNGVAVTLPAATAIDSWTQFYKNMATLIVVFLIVFSGTLTGEIDKGTLVPFLTKGLSRGEIILAKWASLAMQWTWLYVLCFAATWGYTSLLLPGTLANLLTAGLFLWLFGLLLIALLLFFSVLFFNYYGVLLGLGAVALLLSVLSIASMVEPYSPYRLASENVALISGALPLSDFLIPATLTFLLIPGFLSVSICLFRKKSL